ncbi:hypothetical protein HanRHA438_Chr13g0588761 [Helianthus annuus]|uniref:Uncharacterized protein n=1 Tax=Helianthus annuus TaxID=4232 RepID=A0A251SPP4_HELAN|nr:hypothetical protein HanXRQr2_Chr13g0577941 [Helianthus annuus]KAJ0476134.1 hypothetical protein HanHA300_Chr13g0473761 [Helianthus annuus]KAJ0480206.1 hypothetical protein HanIR_Chr13g0628941 [Helianthus annuus]KAJ0496941.1 hypothetical protein HanHA89_Chr13g0505681 [Helianthus annuus]KAJ0670474.1 hypothetical protein HanOQP8_Chr13g0474701 [Helianthus annuus]
MLSHGIPQNIEDNSFLISDPTIDLRFVRSPNHYFVFFWVLKLRFLHHRSLSHRSIPFDSFHTRQFLQEDVEDEHDEGDSRVLVKPDQ